ncbi:MAG: hypothetical protein WCO78_03975 [Candidatus Roizmanbacteria bacterium]
MIVVIPQYVSAQGCTCPTSQLTVEPQVVQPGDPITLTFPYDRAMYIENQTTGGLAQEAGHVDSLGGGSIHIENGSKNYYTFHAGSICGTYTWNHQSRSAPNCQQCAVSTQFTVCGAKSTSPSSTPLPTDRPLPTNAPLPTSALHPTDAPYAEPTPIIETLITEAPVSLPTSYEPTSVPLVIDSIAAPIIQQQIYVQPVVQEKPYSVPISTPISGAPAKTIQFVRPEIISVWSDKTRVFLSDTFQPFTKRSDIQVWEVTKSFMNDLMLKFINEAGL